MSALAPIIFGVGQLASGIGSVSAGNARAEAAAADAEARRQQADELDRRAGYAEDDIRRSGAEFIGAQRDAFGYSGFAADSGALLSELERTNSAMERQVASMRRDAGFRASQLRKGADVSDDLSGDYSATGWLSGAGSLLSGGYSFGSASGWWQPKQQATSLKSDYVSPGIDAWDPFGVGRAHDTYRGPNR